MNNLEIYIATHRPYIFYNIDDFYPIQTGKALSSVDLGIQGDNTGDNISAKNKHYCELTALYWIWKNTTADFVGLCHYCRYFGIVENNELKILNNLGLKQALKDERYVIVPNAYTNQNDKQIFTIRQLYEENHHLKDWLLAKDVISDLYPEYLSAFERLENSTSMHYCNIFVAHRRFINRYCEWLFNILFTLEQRIDISQYDNYQQRVYGFLSERLFNVYLEQHRAELNIIQLPLIHIPEPIKITSNYVPQ